MKVNLNPLERDAIRKLPRIGDFKYDFLRKKLIEMIDFTDAEKVREGDKITIKGDLVVSYDLSFFKEYLLWILLWLEDNKQLPPDLSDLFVLLSPEKKKQKESLEAEYEAWKKGETNETPKNHL